MTNIRIYTVKQDRPWTVYLRNNRLLMNETRVVKAHTREDAMAKFDNWRYGWRAVYASLESF